MLERGDARIWDGPHSCIVTEIIDSPGKRFLNFFLAAGRMRELVAMTPLVLEWGKLNGCTHALMTGRPGWARTKLLRDWHKHDAIIMEKAL